MKYIKYDFIGLIRDYENNNRTLMAVKTQLKIARQQSRKPYEGTTENEWDNLVNAYSIKEQEYQMYCDLVILGFNGLSEIERNILKWWLQDEKDDDYIMLCSGIQDENELGKMKKFALNRFANIIAPN